MRERRCRPGVPSVAGVATLLALSAAGAWAPAASQASGSLYYRGPQPGSASAFSPFSAVLHSGFYNFQIDNRGDDPFAVSYALGFRNVLRNLVNPIGAVAEYGLGRFLTSEVLPNPKRESGQWVPNYFGHVLGEGMVFRYNYEWYRYNAVPHPKLMAAVSVLAGAMLNEVVENGSYQGTNVDPIADFYIFNPLGMVLFSSDRVAKFFRTHLGMAYWPLQALYDPAASALDNVGYRTVFRWHPGSARLGVFATYGTQGRVELLPPGSIRTSPLPFHDRRHHPQGCCDDRLNPPCSPQSHAAPCRRSRSRVVRRSSRCDRGSGASSP